MDGTFGFYLTPRGPVYGRLHQTLVLSPALFSAPTPQGPQGPAPLPVGARHPVLPPPAFDFAVMPFQAAVPAAAVVLMKRMVAFTTDYVQIITFAAALSVALFDLDQEPRDLPDNLDLQVLRDALIAETSMLALFLICFFLYEVTLVFLTGRTLGRYVFGLRVVTLDGTHPRLHTCVLRTLIKFVVMVLVCPLLAALIPVDQLQLDVPLELTLGSLAVVGTSFVLYMWTGRALHDWLTRTTAISA